MTLNLNGHSTTEAHMCTGHISKWEHYFAKIDISDVALLEIPAFEDSYMDAVRSKTRNMVRKAENNGYDYSTFKYNDHLKDMERVNKSTPYRQDRRMGDSYRQRVTPIMEGVPACHLHTQVYIGGFKDDHLVAYCWLVLCNQVAILNRIIGHADHLRGGVMNGLIKEIVENCQRHRAIQYLNYLNMASSTDSLEGFKKRVGFESYKVRIAQ